MSAGDRSRVRLLDKLAKQNGWRSLCVVGVKDDLEAKSLISWSGRLNVTVIWEPRDVRTRQERGRQQRACERMRRWEATTKRLSLVEMSCADAADHLAGEQFDAVALWGLSPAQLAEDGGKWAALVRDGGMLLGTGSRSPDVRGVLVAAVDKWRQLRDGVWRVDVKRTVGELPEELVGGGGVDLAHAVDAGGEASAPADELAGAAIDIAHDPVDSGSGEGEAVQVEPSVVRRAPRRKPVVEAEVADDNVTPPAPKRRGGRPKGSKNKPKVASEA